MLHPDTKFFLDDTELTASQLVDLKNIDLWLQEVQRVVKFCLLRQADLSFHTSGSTGTPNMISHPRHRLEASAKATLDYFDLRPGQKALLVLPANLTGGAMMIIRACVGGLHLFLQKPSTVPRIPVNIDFVPLTPAQFIKAKASNGFQGFEGVVLLGGSAVPPTFDIDSEINVFHGFGMTETASHVALRRLGSPLYKAVGSTTFSIEGDGNLVIDAPHLNISALKTVDQVRLHSNTTFQYLGRANLVINAGGVKIHPEQHELWLQQHGIQAFLVGLEDDVFGEVPILVADSKETFDSWSSIKSEWPTIAVKRALLVPEIPKAAQDKVNRRALKELVKSHQDRLFPLE